MKVLSLFDGISCARVALAKAGHLSVQYFASEIDLPAIATAKKNYPDTVHIGNVEQVSAENVAGGGYRFTHRRLAVPGLEHCDQR